MFRDISMGLVYLPDIVPHVTVAMAQGMAHWPDNFHWLRRIYGTDPSSAHQGDRKKTLLESSNTGSLAHTCQDMKH